MNIVFFVFYVITYKKNGNKACSRKMQYFTAMLHF